MLCYIVLENGYTNEQKASGQANAGRGTIKCLPLQQMINELRRTNFLHYKDMQKKDADIFPSASCTIIFNKQHFTTFTPPRKLMKLVYTRPELSPLDFLRFGL
jgi:hypothetical protein